MKKYVDIAVIGGGPAGLAAALEAWRTQPELSILIIERDHEAGGILQQCIHNGFGLHFFGEELTGPEYAGRFIAEVAKTSVEIMTDTMVLEINDQRQILAVSAENGLIEVEAKAIVLAMGCRERTRGALNIPGARPAGVYTAGAAGCGAVFSMPVSEEASLGSAGQEEQLSFLITRQSCPSVRAQALASSVSIWASIR